MRTSPVVPVLVTLVLFTAPTLASAQREPLYVERSELAAQEVTQATHAHERAPHLGHPRLTAPSAGDYALPVTGIVLGAAVFIAGGGFVLVGLLSAVGEGLAHQGHTTSSTLLGVGGAGLALGAACLIGGVVGIVGLRRQARAAREQPSLGGVAMAPTDGGVSVAAWGTF